MLSAEEKERYSRQLLQIGEEGQKRLKNASVLIAGVGGLGSLAALYLAAAGIGRLRLADGDTVSLSDLNRQILYSRADVGRVKIEAASERLRALNDACRIEPVPADICAEAETLLEGCDLVIDAVDNVPARRAINRAAVRLGKPMIHGGIDGFSGTVTVILPGRGACFECLFPDRGAAPSPRAVPAIGPVVGMVSSLQCCEAMKLLLSIGRPMTDRMLIFRADTGEWKSVQTRRNPECALCAPLP